MTLKMYTIIAAGLGWVTSRMYFGNTSIAENTQVIGFTIWLFVLSLVIKERGKE